MARLPGERYLIQQADGVVRLFEDFTEHEILWFDPANSIMTATALERIRDSDDLGDEDKCFACFWAGYFHFCAGPGAEMTRSLRTAMAEDGTVLVTDGHTEVVRFDPADASATAQAQKLIHDSALIQPERDRAHFWSGFFYAQASGG